MRLSFILFLLFTLRLVSGEIGHPAATAEGPTAKRPHNTPAQTVLLGGKILTLDAGNRVVQAVAIRNGKILAVGDDEAIQKHMTDETQVIDLGGKTVIPGLIETHCHAIGVARGALQQEYVELTSIAEVQNWIRKAAKDVPAGRWISVPRTDITRLKERRHPTPAELDAGTTTHPVLFNAARKNVLNSLGFERAGITDETESISGGEILRDNSGNPLMIAGGDSHLRKLLPTREFTDEETTEALREVHRRYNEVGITSIFERATNLDGIAVYNKLHDDGQLTVRMTATIRQQFQNGEQVEAFTDKLGVKTGDGDDWVRVGPLKITVDGGIHWGNTFLSEPYGEKRIGFYVHKNPEYRGDLRYSVAQMTGIFDAGHRLGWQMCCHVTGDAGIANVLEALENVHQKQPLDRRRFTLVHAYFPDKNIVTRAKRLGVGVDTQPYLYYKDSEAIAEVYGESWARRFIGVGGWVRAGIPTAINSDHMIGLDANKSMNSYNPFLQMWIAISRQNDRGRVHGEHQKISRLDALRCMTTSAAWLGFDEQKKGSLAVGRLADLVILDRDFLNCPENKIREIRPLKTMVDGKIVFERSERKVEN